MPRSINRTCLLWVGSGRRRGQRDSCKYVQYTKGGSGICNLPDLLGIKHSIDAGGNWELSGFPDGVETSCLNASVILTGLFLDYDSVDSTSVYGCYDHPNGRISKLTCIYSHFVLLLFETNWIGYNIQCPLCYFCADWNKIECLPWVVSNLSAS